MYLLLFFIRNKKTIIFNFNVFLAGVTTEVTWIPVLSAGGGENTLRPQNQDQSINKTIHLVEKALKIGVPSFCVIFIAAFFAV